MKYRLKVGAPIKINHNFPELYNRTGFVRKTYNGIYSIVVHGNNPIPIAMLEEEIDLYESQI